MTEQVDEFPGCSEKFLVELKNVQINMVGELNRPETSGAQRPETTN